MWVIRILNPMKIKITPPTGSTYLPKSQLDLEPKYMPNKEKRAAMNPITVAG